MKTTENKITRRNGELLHGTLYEKENISTDNLTNKGKIVILCHGFTGDQNEWGRFEKTAKELVKHGFDALTFDFAGSGKNEREPITLSLQVENLEDVYNWIVNQGYSSIGTIGLSFGGLTSLIPNLSNRKVAVFWAPAFYFMKIMDPKMRFIFRLFMYLIPWKTIKRESKNNKPILINGKFAKELFKLNSNKYLSQFNIPSLLIQGTADDVIGPENNYEAFTHFPNDEDHKLIKVKDANHDFNNIYLDQFISESIKWLEKYM